VSIGVEGAERIGVVHDPSRGEVFADARIDAGVRQVPLAPSRQTDLTQALIGTGFSYSADTRAKQAEVLTGVLPKVRDIRRGGSLALDLAWVACGRLDAIYEHDTHPWDVSAGIAMLEAAGGAVHEIGNLTIAAGNQTLLRRLEDLVLGAGG
jgi:myo-inositol-1(or 4)-monophosphatase